MMAHLFNNAEPYHLQHHIIISGELERYQVEFDPNSTGNHSASRLQEWLLAHISLSLGNSF